MSGLILPTGGALQLIGDLAGGIISALIKHIRLLGGFYFAGQAVAHFIVVPSQKSRFFILAKFLVSGGVLHSG